MKVTVNGHKKKKIIKQGQTKYTQARKKEKKKSLQYIKEKTNLNFFRYDTRVYYSGEKGQIE